MRVTRFGAWVTGFAVLVFTIALIGCGDKPTPKSNTETENKEPGKTAAKTALKPGTGTFKGKVTLVGDMPNIAKLNEELHALMEKADATQKPTCLTDAPADQKTATGLENQR